MYQTVYYFTAPLLEKNGSSFEAAWKFLAMQIYKYYNIPKKNLFLRIAWS